MSENFQSKELRRNIRKNNRINKLERLLSHILHRKFSWKNRSFMSSLQRMDITQDTLKSYFQSESPFLLIRFGLYEYQVCYQYLEKKNGLRQEYSDFIREHMRIDAGIIGKDDTALDDYAEYVLMNLKEADMMAYWRNYPEKSVFSTFFRLGSIHVDVNDLYPYPFWHKEKLPDWQLCLKNKKVLVVTSFAETVRKQYANRLSLWKDADRILPQFYLSVYQSVTTNGGAVDERFASWNEAVEFMEQEILKIDFDIALVSCGGYGIPLAIRLKKQGKKIIQWGGCYQLWFGILGGRWKDDPMIRPYINEYWVFPSKEETPPLAEKVDGSAYW